MHKATMRSKKRVKRGDNSFPPKIAKAAKAIASFITNTGSSFNYLIGKSSIKFLASVRICSALWSIISDCDETFNYWEPMHFLVEGWGLQTWEYSPLYAIRSYAYLWIHSIPSVLFKAIFGAKTSKVLLFFYTRFFLAIICAACESYFIAGVASKFSPLATRLVLAIHVVSIGMFISSSAFLPSSFSMYMTLLILGGWMKHDLRISILATMASVLIGWPFSGVIAIPVGIHMLLDPIINTSSSFSSTTLQRKIVANVTHLLKWSIILLFCVLIPLVVIDSLHYGKLTLASFNIVMYNVLSGSKGPELYGTEPWTFYPFNLLLNFNVVFIASCALLPIVLMIKLFNFIVYLREMTEVKDSAAQSTVVVKSYHIVILCILCLWYLIFLPQKHKEERFMFPIYPVICLSAALTLDLMNQVFGCLEDKTRNVFLLGKVNWSSLCLNLTLLLILMSGVFSVSRGITLFKGFHAPFDVYTKVESIHFNVLQWEQNSRNHTMTPEDIKQADATVFSVCVGKEWHRFPSSFFLPTKKFKLKFLKSHFAGLLPGEYPEDTNLGVFNITRTIPENMNDMNREDFSRYVSVETCHFIIDTDFTEFTPEDVPYSRDTNRYEVVYSYPFLDVSKTEFPWRSFFIPFLSHEKWKMVNYNLLRDRNNTSLFPDYLFNV
jgi:alpha-1,2-mannosyltransferase